jgi:hypothetical protein
MDMDDHTPDDLREVEHLLYEGRLDLTPFEADAMRQRIERRSARRFARLRRRGMATALITGAIVSSGGTAVLAATAVTGGSTSTIFPSTYHPPTSGNCQYHPSWTKTFTFKKDSYTTITVTISYDCMTNKFTITITCSKPITYYYCNGKKVTVPSNTKTTTFVLSPGVQSLSVASGGATASFPLLLTP